MVVAVPSSKEGLLQMTECRNVAKVVRDPKTHLSNGAQILFKLETGAKAPGTMYLEGVEDVKG